MAPTPLSTLSATTPWLLSRSSRLALAAKPFSRRYCLAASMSPSVSSSAFLQSIIPAPVLSRSAFTSCAVNAMSVFLKLVGVNIESAKRSGFVGQFCLGGGLVSRGRLLVGGRLCHRLVDRGL